MPLSDFYKVPDLEESDIPSRPADKLFPNRKNSMANKECTYCGIKISGLRDQKSVDEWKISGLCQKCQDEVFGE